MYVRNTHSASDSENSKKRVEEVNHWHLVGRNGAHRSNRIEDTGQETVKAMH